MKFIRLIIALVVGVALVVLLWRVSPRPEEILDAEPLPVDPAVEIEVAAPDAVYPDKDDKAVEVELDSFLDTYVQSVRDRDPELGFDMDAHFSALEKLGPEHLSGMAAMAGAAESLRQYEAEERLADPARAAMADKIDDLRQQLAAWEQKRREALAGDQRWRDLEQALAKTGREIEEARAGGAPPRGNGEERMARLRETLDRQRDLMTEKAGLEEKLTVAVPEVGEPAAAIAGLELEIEKKEKELRRLFAADERWQRLRDELDLAEQRRNRSYQRLASAIRARMHFEHEHRETERRGE